MDNKYQPIWEKVKKPLSEATMKDFVLHSQMVEKAMREIIAGEGGDPDILIPAAILHDIGWSKVDTELQCAQDPESRHKAMVAHIENAPALIKNILSELNYDKDKIERIVDLVVAHKFTDPEDKDKQKLIDADTLSDTYKESFWSDIKSYDRVPKDMWDHRSKNTFYTTTARSIFGKQLNNRLEEIQH